MNDIADRIKKLGREIDERLSIDQDTAGLESELIALRAERRAGEILKEGGRKEGETDKSIRSQGSTLSPKISEIGITKNQSSKWKQIADIPEEKFEEYIEKSEDITTAGKAKP